MNYVNSSFPGVTRRERQMAFDIGNLLGLPLIRGQWFWLDGGHGNDANNGKRQNQAFATWDDAYAACTDGAGDGIVCMSHVTATSSTFAKVDAAITWAKSSITVFGMGAPTFYNQRASMRFNTGITGYYLINITGYNNTFINIGFHNESDKSDAQVCAVKLTSSLRNAFLGCDFKASPATASAYKCDLWLSNAHENLFDKCNFGNSSYDFGNNAACWVYIDGTSGNAQDLFRECTFVGQVSTGTAVGGLKCGNAAALNGVLIFDRCTFALWQANTGLVVMTSWFIGTKPTTGCILLKDCGNAGFNLWDSATGNDRVVVASGATVAAAGGVGVVAS